MEQRLIDANALLSKGHFVVRTNDFGEQFVTVEEINKMPTVDAVQVVRCGECLWFAELCTDFKAKTHCDGMCENPRLDRCVHGDYVLKNWFCADGERRNDEQQT